MLKANACFRRGNRLFREKKYADALPDYRAATEASREADLAFSRLGMTYGKLGRWGEAVPPYRRAYEINPK
ncbi:MAG: tetratricopeptide repeat protein [Gemmataceae bacterium]|nr:tetratricopeptide repeat protein [Gemmataceae bacterium]